jgi:hypothetical protein
MGVLPPFQSDDSKIQSKTITVHNATRVVKMQNIHGSERIEIQTMRTHNLSKEVKSGSYFHRRKNWYGIKPRGKEIDMENQKLHSYLINPRPEKRANPLLTEANDRKKTPKVCIRIKDIFVYKKQQVVKRKQVRKKKVVTFVIAKSIINLLLYRAKKAAAPTAARAPRPLGPGVIATPIPLLVTLPEGTPPSLAPPVC